jgi:CxxC-x17-CxxC domain-containing protein
MKIECDVCGKEFEVPEDFEPEMQSDYLCEECFNRLNN